MLNGQGRLIKLAPIVVFFSFFFFSLQGILHLLHCSILLLTKALQLYSTVTLRQGEKKHYNNKVDVYSFGIVLWELLTNRMPFEGMSNLQAAYAAAFKVKKLPVGTVIYLCFKLSIHLVWDLLLLIERLFRRMQYYMKKDTTVLVLFGHDVKGISL